MEENRVLELQRETPVYDTVDVLVLGAGPAGWGAAISAAREGAKTLLVEGQGEFTKRLWSAPTMFTEKIRS